MGFVTIPATPEICTAGACERSHYAKGFCKNHYNSSLKRTGRIKKRPCTVDGCDRLTGGRYCSSHLRRKRAGTMDLPIQRHEFDARCTADGCEEKHYAKGFCSTHYAPFRTKHYQNFSANRLREKYGITPEEREAISEFQGGACAICKEPPPEGKVLCVDHDHSHCGGPRKGCRYCVRGLLCNTCNRWMDKVAEHPELGASVQAYLDDPPAFHVIERAPEPRKKPFADALELLQELGLRD